MSCPCYEITDTLDYNNPKLRDARRLKNIHPAMRSIRPGAAPGTLLPLTVVFVRTQASVTGGDSVTLELVELRNQLIMIGTPVEPMRS